MRSHATTPAISAEVESGTITAPATVVSDASASMGKAVAFGSAGITPPSGGRTCPAYPLPPNASCTGVPAGTALTTVNGDFSTISNGQVIEGKTITGDLIVNNSNVTVTDTRIKGRVANQASSGLIIEDSDIGADTCPNSNSDYNNLNGTGYQLIRSHVHNAGADLIGIGGTGTINIQDSIINQACFYPGDHLDAAQFYAPGAVGKITIMHTVLDVHAVNTSDKGNSAIFWADTPGSGTRLTVNQSFLTGGNYTVALYDAGASSGVVLDVSGNTFTKNSWVYGPCAMSNSVIYNGTAGVKFSGNVYDDGTSIGSC